MVNAMYFSPTGTTRKVVSELAKKIAENLNPDAAGNTSAGLNTVDFTLPEVRLKPAVFSENEILVLGVPVYAGRVPNILLKYLANLKGSGTIAIPVVLYGNRNYDDALIELRDILDSNGFKVIAAGAFVGEHSFSKTLAQNRPDAEDMSAARQFALQIVEKLKSPNLQTIDVYGNRPYRKYYMPRDREGNPVDIRKVTPKTNSDCINCKLCVSVCPMGSINLDDPSKLEGICIKCGACIKQCPVQAKYYDDADYLRHKHELEIEFAERREPDLFI